MPKRSTRSVLPAVTAPPITGNLVSDVGGTIAAGLLGGRQADEANRIIEEKAAADAAEARVKTAETERRAANEAERLRLSQEGAGLARESAARSQMAFEALERERAATREATQTREARDASRRMAERNERTAQNIRNRIVTLQQNPANEYARLQIPQLEAEASRYEGEAARHYSLAGEPDITEAVVPSAPPAAAPGRRTSMPSPPPQEQPQVPPAQEPQPAAPVAAPEAAPLPEHPRLPLLVTSPEEYQGMTNAHVSEYVGDISQEIAGRTGLPIDHGWVRSTAYLISRPETRARGVRQLTNPPEGLPRLQLDEEAAKQGEFLIHAYEAPQREPTSEFERLLASPELNLTPEQRREFIMRRVDQINNNPTQTNEEKAELRRLVSEAAAYGAAQGRGRATEEGLPTGGRQGADWINPKVYARMASDSQNLTAFSQSLEGGGQYLSELPSEQRNFLNRVAVSEAEPEDEATVRQQLEAYGEDSQSADDFLAALRDENDADRNRAVEEDDRDALIAATGISRLLERIARERFAATPTDISSGSSTSVIGNLGREIVGTSTRRQ